MQHEAPLRLWRVATPGCYYEDAHGRPWAPWSGSARQKCARCGALIDRGYRTPADDRRAARYVCVADVLTIEGAPSRDASGQQSRQDVTSWGTLPAHPLSSPARRAEPDE